MTIDQATISYIAAQDLRRLYNAYRATSKANIWVLRNLRHNVLNNDTMSSSERMRAIKQLHQREALSTESDIVFKIRVDQLEQRIDEIEKIIES